MATSLARRYHAAAEGGDARAQNSLAVMLAQGFPPEVPADPLGAVMWFQRSSAQVSSAGSAVRGWSRPACHCHECICLDSWLAVVAHGWVRRFTVFCCAPHTESGTSNSVALLQPLSGVQDTSFCARGCIHRRLLGIARASE